MKTQLDIFRRPLWIGASVALAFAAASTAAIVGWAPAAAEPTIEVHAPELTPGAEPRCAECGVIVSKREIDNASGEASPRSSAEPPRNSSLSSSPRYEFTVRMADGSKRVFDAVQPANWRVGERVTLIGGDDPPIQ